MMADLTLEEIKTLHDKAYDHNQVTRDKASDDYVFYWITQWDDNLLSESQLQYRGEFNILRKAGRDLMGNLRANTFQVNFEPKDEDRMDAGDLADGLYRTTEYENTSIEAFNNAMQETVVCGVGAWELYTAYETNAVGEDKQIIKRRPLYEANNNVFWDPQSQLLDKSDADYCSVLAAYSEDGYRKEVSRLQGIAEEDVEIVNFKYPNESYTFPWVWEDSRYYIARFYHKETVQEKNYLLQDPFGMEMIVRDFEFEKIEEEALDAGYEIVDEFPVNRDVVTLYYVSGSEIIASFRIPGNSIPVVPYFGETQYVEGQMCYEGITRLAKDPQRLRNFIMSYIADIAGRSPRPKPIFTQDQIGGFEFMYNNTGIDNNYPYLLQNAYDAQGNPNPIGPAGVMPDSPIPNSVAALVELTREGVEDVANPGIPQDIADTDLSGKAVRALQAKIDEQWYIYRDNYKHAKRRDGVIFANMASEVYDTPRKVTLTNPDGSRTKAQIMEVIIDKETGEAVPINDITNMEWEVYADIGTSYANKREETFERLGEMAAEAAATGDTALVKMFMLKRLELLDGVQMDSIREYARKQLILMGIEEPQDEEEEAMLAAQQQQQQQPDPAALLAQAELLKGQAAQMREQREAVKDQANIQNENAKTQIDAFEAETDRQKVMVEAQKAGADIDLTRTKTVGQRIENMARAIQPLQQQTIGA